MEKLNWYDEQDLSLLAKKEAMLFISPESYWSVESQENARDHVEIIADYLYDKFSWDYEMFCRYCKKFNYEPYRQE